jgi:hypothetical protein
MEFIIKTRTYRALLLPLGATRRGEAGEAKAGAFAYAGGIWERCLYRDPRLGQVRLLRIQLNSSKQRGVEKPGGQEFRSSGVRKADACGCKEYSIRGFNRLATSEFFSPSRGAS